MTRMRLLVSLGLLALAALIACQAPRASAQALPLVAPLFTDPARVTGAAESINNAGQIAGGGFFNGSASYTPYLWSPSSPNAATGTFAALGLPKSWRRGQANAVNASGDVVGFGRKVDDPFAIRYALLWAAGGAPQVLVSSSVIATEAYGINSAREVVGWYEETQATGFAAHRAFLSQVVNGKRKTFLIGEGDAIAINDSGRILVRGGANGPYYWQITGPNGAGVRTEIAGADSYLGGVSGMNASGQVSGTIPGPTIVSGDGVSRATRRAGLYTPGSGWQDLGFPSTPPPAGGEWLYAGAGSVSDSGIVVGEMRAVDFSGPGPYTATDGSWVWDATNGMRDLNVLLAGTGWQVTRLGSQHVSGRTAVNSAGQIIGRGSFNGGPEQWILIRL